LNYDWWYEHSKADEMIELNVQPLTLSPEGLIYYIRFQKAVDNQYTSWIDTLEHQELKDAAKPAEAKVVSGILCQD
jgi:hypothetical protein